MHRVRVLPLLLLAAVVALAGARAADAADPALRRCRASCKRAKSACEGQAKKDLRTLLGDCAGSATVRRECRRRAKSTARGARATCASFLRDCRACCGGSGSECAARCGDGTVNVAQGEQCDPAGAACGSGGVCDAQCHCPSVSTTIATAAPTTSTTMATSPPSSPAIVFLIATDPDEITLAWLPAVDDTTPASAIRYEVHVAQQPDFDPDAASLRASMGGFPPGDAPHGVVGGLTPGTTYYVLVVAVDDAGLRSTTRYYGRLTLPTLPVVRSTTTPLETAEALALGDPLVTGSTYTYAARPGARSPSAGALLFGTTGSDAYLRRVDAVVSAAGQIVVETSDASLSDAVPQMALSSAHVLFDVGRTVSTTASGIGGARATSAARSAAGVRWGRELLVATETVPSRSAGGVTVAPGPRAGGFTLHVGRDASASSDVDVDSSVDFEPELRTEATWTTDLLDGVTLQSAEVVARGSLRMSVGAHYRFLAAASVQRTVPFPVLTRTYSSVYLVGGVPVQQEITFTLNAEISANASAAIDATATAGATATVEFGVRYNPATEAWDDVASATIEPSLTADLVVKGKVAGTVRLVPRIEVKFYEVVSAYLSIEPSAQAEIETQATSSAPCAPFELEKFDVGLVVEPFVSADFRALARNVSLLGKTRVGGPFTFALFGLPSAQVSSQDRGNGMLSLLATVTDGLNDPFDPASARWDVSPPTASIVPATGSSLATLTCQQMGTYTVTFSGNGVLGEEARRCTAIEVPCRPPTTTTTSPSTTSSTGVTTSTSAPSTTTSTSSTTSTTSPTGVVCGTFLTKWGTSGNGPGQFVGPRAVAVDRDKNVYVSDGGTNRIQKFDRNGVFVTTWGTTGSGDGGFLGLLGVAVGTGGHVYAVDSGANRIQKFDANGTFLLKWGSAGAGDGQFNGPLGIATDGFGNVYVADPGNSRVQKFDPNGGFLAKWGTAGHLDGEFSTLRGLATDAIGNVFTVEQSGRRIQKFDANGGFLAKWGALGDPQFRDPYAVATDELGNVFVSDVTRGDIQKFSGGGTFLAKWGSTGTGNGQFQFAMGLASDGEGNVYVADRDLRRIQKFACP